MSKKLAVKVSDIHESVLFATAPFECGDILLRNEPLLFRASPELALTAHGSVDTGEATLSAVLQWWRDFQLLAAAEKRKFWALSAHEFGAIVQTVDAVIGALKKSGVGETVDLWKLRKALAIDKTNAFCGVRGGGTYELICRVNHSCDPNCVVSLEGCVVAIADDCDSELKWNYSGDSLLYANKNQRVAALTNVWGAAFHCHCLRCAKPKDDMCAYACPRCRRPTVRQSATGQFAIADCDSRQCGHRLTFDQRLAVLRCDDALDCVVEAIGAATDEPLPVDCDALRQLAFLVPHLTANNWMTHKLLRVLHRFAVANLRSLSFLTECVALLFEAHCLCTEELAGVRRAVAQMSERPTACCLRFLVAAMRHSASVSLSGLKAAATNTEAMLTASDLLLAFARFTVEKMQRVQDADASHCLSAFVKRAKHTFLRYQALYRF